MVTIITGKINDRKTTRALKHYQNARKGDGFLALKTMAKTHVKSYHIKRLSTNEERVWILHEAFFNDTFPIADTIGPYVLNKDTLEWIDRTIDALIKKKTQPLYLDEIGLLELNDQGLANIFKKMLSSGLDLVVVIREDLLDDMIKKYSISDFLVLPLGKEDAYV